MGGNGVGLDSGGGSRGAWFGGLGMPAIFSPFGTGCNFVGLDGERRIVG